MEELKITDNGETEVQIATVGQVIGSDRVGNPVEQNFTKESFANIAANLSGEILVDKDHASLKPGVEKDSEAMGWLSDVKANERGLFGKIKWTELGRKLIESRAFRFLSPVFRLNANREPEQLVNVAITNIPSQHAIKPIINSMLDMGALIVTPPEVEVTDEEKEDFNNNSNEGIIKMEVTREELAEMIAAMIKTYLAESMTKTEEVKEEVKEEVVEAEVANTESTESTEETKTEEVKTEEKKEVIQAEALNSAPTLAVSVAEVSDFEKALDASLRKNCGHFTRI